MTTSKITVIGCGNMGRSLVGGLIADGRPASSLCAADPDAAQRQRMQSQFWIEVVADNDAALEGADVVIFAVKPQSMKAVVSAAAPRLRELRPLILSIAAGIRLHDIGRWLGADLSLVRAMPNTPALIRAGATALCAAANVSAAQRDEAEQIVRAVGSALWIDDENLLDVVTALSGSGPAYFFLLMETLEKAAAELGLPAEQARVLTLETALGAARMALAGDSDPAELRRQVTSKGGTTEAAMRVLERAGLARAFGDALRAASQRAAELARTYGAE
ncbi:MAG: pyrroline-5-carboxylate reductase [Gammaproteobacteria bacterium]|nr:pyrroline-5-carboxylate reductase [Gammaproteobacteria bacterium]